MLRKFCAAIAVIGSITAAHAVHAAVIDFEGSTVTGASRNLDQDGANLHGPSLINYAGYNWLGMSVSKPLVSVNRPRQITGFENDPEDGPIAITTPVDTGFHRSVVSGETVAFLRATGGSSLFGSIKALPGDDTFNFISTYITSAYRDDVTATITGLRDGVAVYSEIFTIGVDAPTLLQLDFVNIDEIQFLSSGGTFLYPNSNTVGGYANPTNAFSAPILVFDDMVITPYVAAAISEPASLGMLGLSVVGMGMVAHRRRRG